MSNNDRIFVFVYGTLKEGYGNSRIIEDLKCSTMLGWVKGSLFDLGPYPAYKMFGDNTIYGEIHELSNPKEALKRLDRLEGYSEARPEKHNLYNRRKIMVNIMDDPENSQVECYIYEFSGRIEEIKNDNKIKELVNGIWDPKSYWGNNGKEAENGK